MEKLTVPKGDFGYRLSFTVQDSSGTAYNITAYTVKLKVWKQGVPGTLVLNVACTPLVAASGTCYYDVLTTNFDTVGRYSAELELTIGATNVESTETFTITVVESG